MENYTKSSNPEFKKKFKARIYMWVLAIIRFVDVLPKDMSTQVFAKQLIRSSTSVLANYVEADSASSKKDFINFFTYSLKSANESKVWLALIKDTDRAPADATNKLLDELTEIAKILATSILTLKGKR